MPSRSTGSVYRSKPLAGLRPVRPARKTSVPHAHTSMSLRVNKGVIGGQCLVGSLKSEKHVMEKRLTGLDRILRSPDGDLQLREPSQGLLAYFPGGHVPSGRFERACEPGAQPALSGRARGGRLPYPDSLGESAHPG